MALETPVFISDLVATNPPATDPKSEGAAHLRNIKSALKTTFPNVTGAVTATQLELNQLAGSTSAIQAQLNSKAPAASPVITVAATLPAATTIGTVTAAEVSRLSGVTGPIQTQINTKAPIASPVFTGVVNLPPTGFGVTEAVTKGYADGLAFASALPAQAGNANKIITTNGVTASWQTNRSVLPITIVTATTQTAVDGNHYVMTNTALSTLTLPASPANGIGIDVTFANSRTDNIVARNGSGLMVTDAGLPIFEDLIYDVPSVTLSLVFAGNAWRFRAQGSSIAITETIESTALALRNATETAALLSRNSTEAAALLTRGYEAPVAYVTGISLTRTTQTVSQAGVVYTPVPGSVPFTTSGTFETASFRVIQGVMGSDLAAGTGAGLVGFLQSGVGAATRTLQSKSRDSVSVKDFGAVGNGISNDTANFQAAVDYAASVGCALNVPEGTYRLTAPIVSTTGYRLRGSAVQPYQGALGAFGVGSWLYFDHTGIGLDTGIASTVSSGFEVKDIGTRRNQPAPAPGWAPNPHDFDIRINSCDANLENLMLLNATKGILLDNGGYGRLSFRRIRGQCFKVGVQIETSYDVVTGDHLHLWPFWADDANVKAYTMANLDAIYLKRCDNPKFSNIFSIFAKSGIRFGQNANGSTSKVKFSNGDFDRGLYGVFVDPTVTNGVSGQFVNITHQGETAVAGSKFIFIQGNNSVLDFANLKTDLCNQNGIRVEGANNVLRLANVSINNFDQASANFPAIEAFASNRVEITGKPIIGSAGGGGGAYSTTGLIAADDWRVFTPIVSAQTGVITSYTSTGRYKLVGSTVSVKATINITNAGTAAGDVRFNLPINNPALFVSVGCGRESSVTGKALQVTASGTAAAVLNFDNTYPGVNNSTLIVDVSYVISL